ncbi:SANT/Myb_domain [Hexamita inflata]|uniref:SANT/Myb domain n=1 Tax=Hexamita inflata TaxID=28002 RepID=A0AA86V190_9EUKA|nr:SANT/Myb domain [Hexamita inflata]
MPNGYIQRWTEEEEQLFAYLLVQYDKDFRRIAAHFPSKSYNQIRCHYYNNLHKQQYEQEQARQTDSPLGYTQMPEFQHIYRKSEEQETKDALNQDYSALRSSQGFQLLEDMFTEDKRDQEVQTRLLLLLFVIKSGIMK